MQRAVIRREGKAGGDELIYDSYRDAGAVDMWIQCTDGFVLPR
ncbi:MAG: hypothetical protein VX346_08615 [Planctomycetota bacterium]|nr:hypothetical protein [Planctomycetota bacterium]